MPEDFEAPDPDVGGAPAGPEVVDDGSFDGGQPAEPEPQPEPQAPPAATAPDPATAHLGGLQGNPLWPVLQHLPPAVMRQISEGKLDPAAAVAKHYGGKRWSDLVQTEGAHRELQKQNQGLMTRFEALVKHLNDTLGVQLPEELQPKEEQPPSEVQQLGEKVDGLVHSLEEQRIEGVMQNITSYVETDRQAVLAAEPQLADAEAFVANRMIEFQTGQARQALEMWQLSKDPQILAQNFSLERLTELSQGLIDAEQLITLTALDRCFDIVAQTQARHFKGGTSAAQDILNVARKTGWQGGGGAPDPNAQPATRTAQQPRPDPNLDKVRRQVNGRPPGPARNGSAPLNTKEIVSRVARMSPESFEQMLSESEDPEKTMDNLLRMTAVH
jgi:hypothetical protein